ncbi:MAG TPA: SDR family NAD(P)-dependent oxidoreductase [Steroidobacteraceae bacterium]
MNEEIRFDGRVAIVTGAGKGLGRAYALYLASRGARVVVNNRRRSGEPSSADAVVEEIRSAGGEALANYDSVEDPSAGERLVQQALDGWGRVDILINNAGVDQHSTFHKLSLDEFKRIFDINFMGSLYVTHAVYRRMRDAGYGRIIVSTSAAGLHGLHGLSAYAASKAALIGFMRTLAAEGRSRNVLVNAIAPFAATPMTARQGVVDEQFRESMRPEWVAPMVAYLVSERSQQNGQVIVAGKGGFRRAAMVEGPGIAYSRTAELTPEQLERDMERILSMDGAREFADAQQSFQDFVRRYPGIR